MCSCTDFFRKSFVSLTALERNGGRHPTSHKFLRPKTASTSIVLLVIGRSCQGRQSHSHHSDTIRYHIDLFKLRNAVYHNPTTMNTITTVTSPSLLQPSLANVGTHGAVTVSTHTSWLQFVATQAIQQAMALIPQHSQQLSSA